jgi:branched-chain amino acid transport system substrate-binding protein
MAKIGSKAGGREIQLIKEDTEAKPDVGLTKIKKLIERDRVEFVVGPVNSVVAIAIRNYVHEQGVPLIVPVAFTRVLTAPPLSSPSIFRIVETSDQGNYPMGAWMMKNTKYRKILLMATDFVAGRDSVQAFGAGFKAAGGEIVGEIYAPLGTPDFAPYLAKAGDSKADAVYAFFGGADGIRFVKQYKEFGLFEKLPLTGYNVLTDDTILPAIGDAALGIVTVGGWSAALDTPDSKAFVAEYEKVHKVWPTRYSESGWDTAQLLAITIDTLKGDLSDRNRVKDALRTSLPRVKAPRGRLEFDASRQVTAPAYVMRAERQGGRIVNAIVEKLPPVPQEKVWGWWKK